MEPVFAKMKEVRNRRKTVTNYEDTKKRIITEKCQHINPAAKYPEQYIETCDVKKSPAKEQCLEYRTCALESIKNIPNPTFEISNMIPDFTFPIHPTLNVPVSYSILNDYNSPDVLENMMHFLQSWKYPLDETTFIVILGAGNVLKQHLLLEPDISDILEKRKHTLIFNIDPEFTFGRRNVNSNTLLKALNNNSHPLWVNVGQRFKVTDAPKISQPYDKFKVYDYTRDDEHTFTYVFIKSFANIFLIHSFFWPKNYENVYKVYINLLASNPKGIKIKKFLFDIYDEIYNQDGPILIENNVVQNNFSLLRRQIEGGSFKVSHKKQKIKRKTQRKVKYYK
jgi:hypothetical protein